MRYRKVLQQIYGVHTFTTNMILRRLLKPAVPILIFCSCVTAVVVNYFCESVNLFMVSRPDSIVAVFVLWFISDSS